MLSSVYFVILYHKMNQFLNGSRALDTGFLNILHFRKQGHCIFKYCNDTFQQFDQLCETISHMHHKICKVKIFHSVYLLHVPRQSLSLFYEQNNVKLQILLYAVTVVKRRPLSRTLNAAAAIIRSYTENDLFQDST